MRIGIDIRAAQLSNSGTRGIGKYIYDLIEGLIRLDTDQEYVLIAFPGKPLPERLAHLPSCCRIVLLRTRLLGEYVWTQPVRYLWRLRYLRAQWAQGRALAALAFHEKLDVLHQPCPINSDYFTLCRPSHCPTVVTFHDAIPAIFPDLYMPEWPVSLQYVYKRQLAACRTADRVVAVSKSSGFDAMRYAGVPQEKLTVVYNTVSDEYLPVSDPARLQECYERLGVKPPYFLFCSAPDIAKNLPRTLDAFARFTALSEQIHQIVLVTQKADSVRAAAFDAGLTPQNTLITGFAADDDLVTLYSGATALLSPSLYEGFGLPAAQAMRAGTPVIASDRSAQPEVVGDAGLLVDPYDVDAIAAAMCKIAGDPVLRADLSARAVERAHLFDWQNQAQAMLSIYRRQAMKKH